MSAQRARHYRGCTFSVCVRANACCDRCVRARCVCLFVRVCACSCHACVGLFCTPALLTDILCKHGQILLSMLVTTAEGKEGVGRNAEPPLVVLGTCVCVYVCALGGVASVAVAGTHL